MSDEPRAKQPSVVDGKLMRTSVSALQKAAGCLRQYWYKYNSDLPDKPEGAGARLGKESHARIQHFLETGENVLSRLERIGLEKGYIPQPHPQLVVEGEFTHLKAVDVDMVGYVDLEDPRDPAHIIVTDWKFKADLSKYMATKEQLTDPYAEAGIQMIGYAEAMRLKHPQASQVTLRHVNFQTQGRLEVVEVSTGPIALAEFADKWVTVTSKLVPRMKEAVAKKDAQEVEKNESMCDRYGGCPYLLACKDRTARILFHRRQLAAPQKEETMIKFGSPSTVPVTPQPPPPPVVTQAPPPPAPPKPPAQAQPLGLGPRVIKAREAIQEAVYTVGNGVKAKFLTPVTKASGTQRYAFIPLSGGGPIQLDGDASIVGEAVGQLPAILPPDAPVSNPLLAAREPAVPSAPQAAPSTPQNEAQMVAALEASVAQAPAASDKKTRKRTAKIEDVSEVPAVTNLGTNPVKVFDAGGHQVLVVPPAPPAVVTSREASVAEGASGFSLYFVGSPVGVPTKTLNTYVEALDAEIRKAGQLNCPDIRLAPGQSDFGFGRWKAFLAKLALEMPPPPGHYIVTSGDERIDCVANALIEKASLVVR